MLLTVEESAQYVGAKNRQIIDYHIRVGNVPCTRRGHRKYVESDDLDTLMEGRGRLGRHLRFPSEPPPDDPRHAEEWAGELPPLSDDIRAELAGTRVCDVCPGHSPIAGFRGGW